MRRLKSEFTFFQALSRLFELTLSNVGNFSGGEFKKIYKQVQQE